MSTLPSPRRLGTMQPYHLPDSNSVNKPDDARGSDARSEIKQEIYIRSSSTSSILTHSTYETTTPIHQASHGDIAPSEISEDELSIRNSSASVLTFSTCGSTETITQVRQLGLADDASHPDEEEKEEDRISSDEPDWKRTGHREPNERYEGGVKDGLRVGRVPLGLVSAARGGGGGDELGRSQGGGSGEGDGDSGGGEESGGNGGGDDGDEKPDHSGATEGPLQGETTQELAKPNELPRALDTIPTPVNYAGLFSVSTTSTRLADAIAADIVRVLTFLGISYEPIRNGYNCVWAPTGSSTKITPVKKGVALDLMMFVELEILVVKMVPLVRLHGLPFKKLAGNTLQSKNVAEHILRELRL